MNMPTVKFPVVCPECGYESLAELPVATVAEALLNRGPIMLNTRCHDASWSATPIEIEQIREYLGAPWLDALTNSSRPYDQSVA
jgi:hypothetical protein